jgi:hypothetical protein
MTPDQIPALIKQISYADPRIMPGDPAELMGMAALWAVALADVPAAFADKAVGEHYAASPYTIKPSDIATRWKTQVRKQLDRHTDLVPFADPDDEVAYRRELRAARRAVAQQSRRPGTVHELTPVPVAYDDIQAMRAQGDLVEFIKLSWREGRAKAAERKALVLKYPDLAARLCNPPLNYKRPDQWSGAIPPETWNGVVNDSPLRPVILELLAEAEAREAS